MVVLTDVKSMFWGVTIESGKHYAQTVEHSFHISMAALELKQAGHGKQDAVGLMIQHDKAEFLLCTLNDRIPQNSLDLNFSEGEDVTFFLNGNGVVHLTGYLLDDSAYDSDLPDDLALGDEDVLSDPEESSDDEDDDSDDDVPALLDMEADEGDSEDDEDYTPVEKAKKRKKQVREIEPSKKVKTGALFADLNDEDDDEDDDFNMDGDEDFESDDSDELDFDDEDDENEDDDDDSEESDDEVDVGSPELPSKLPKQKKTPKTEVKSEKEVTKLTSSAGHTPKDKTHKQSAKKDNSVTKIKTEKQNKRESTSLKSLSLDADSPGLNGQTESSKKVKKEKRESMEEEKATPKSGKKKDKQNKGELQNTPSKQNHPKKTLPGGTIVQDLKEGHGPEAKVDKTVHLYYVGTLKNNGKQFDACQSGKPFKFKLGKGEVIKGWDQAIQGMKVGGKRKITVPPSQGYGNERVGPIPANSTLVFDVELKAVS